ncbi:MAG: sigma 54-interacting transcriptional regulator, partial [Microvirgula sp.]
YRFFVERMSPLAAGRDIQGDGLIGRSPAFRHMLERLARVAPSDETVLLQGASGTGKELVAKALHAASRRAEKPFVTVDCTGLPENLIDSELFGHEKGAFTGAVLRQTGLVEAANGGTLFLDEIGDMPLAMQSKLLRLLETGTYRRLGSTEWRRADVRIVSATHHLLARRVEEGRFRADLYYRLSTFPLYLPPLSERREDIPLLAEALLARSHPDCRFSPAALARLT